MFLDIFTTTIRFGQLPRDGGESTRDARAIIMNRSLRVVKKLVVVYGGQFLNIKSTLDRGRTITHLKCA